MRSNQLTTFLLLSLAVATAVATPFKRQNARQHRQLHSARQVESTTTQSVQAKTGYPPAGFRPHIPFELPHERKPAELPTATSTPAPAAAEVTTPLPDGLAGSGDVNIDVEVIIESDGEEEKVSEEVEKTTATTEAPKQSIEGESEVDGEVEQENPGAETESHTPAIEYGPPTVNGNANAGDDETVVEPVGHFQPPNRDAEEFAPSSAATETNIGADADVVTNSADIDAPAQPVADFPTAEEAGTPAVAAIDYDNSDAIPLDVDGELDAEAAEQHEPASTYGPPTSLDGELDAEAAEQHEPASTYGPPNSVDNEIAHLPADTYGAPGGAVAPPEVEEEDFGVELNELEPVAAAEDADLAAEQIELLSGFRELQSGRLIFVPSDGTNLRQIFFGASPQQRRVNKSGRLTLV